VIVNTQDPKIDGGYTGYLYGHYGNYDDTGLQGAVNLPISDTLAARVAFNGETRDSFYHINGLTSGDPDLHWGSARFGLLWQPNSKLRVLWKTDYDYLDNGGYFGDALLTPTGQLNPTNHLFSFNNNYETYATDQFVRTGLRVDYKFDSGVTFRSVTGYQRGRTGWNGDIDGTDLTGTNPATGAAYPDYIINEKADETIWSQEFNLISPEHGFFNWILGGYYNHNQYDFPAVFDIGVPQGGFDEDLQGSNPTGTYAAFAQASFNLPAGFQLQGGVRYSMWSTTNKTTYFVPEYGPLFDQPQDQRYRGNNVTGKVTLNWNLDARNFLYAFVASGAKPGGLNTTLYTYPVQPIPAPFGQEYVVDYELGWKSRFFDNHVRTQVGAYYNNFFDFQLSIPLPNNPQFTTEVNNTSPTHLYGLEGSVQAVFGHLTFNGNLGLEHSELGAFYAEDARIAIGGTCDPNSGPASTACINLKGHPQQYAPDFTFNLGAQYDFTLPNEDKLTPGVTFAHVSSQWGTIFDNRSQGDYLDPRNILGASLAWTHKSFTTTLYGYNLSNDQYVSAVLPPIRIAGNPRQFGISVLKTF
jgi:iron complex outermembrane recepter protein